MADKVMDMLRTRKLIYMNTINGRNAEILGDDNAKNGPDRIVDGQLIQTKILPKC